MGLYWDNSCRLLNEGSRSRSTCVRAHATTQAWSLTQSRNRVYLIRRTCCVGSGAQSHAEFSAEVDLAHAMVGKHVLRGALRQHGAFVHDVGAIADAERLAHVVIGDEDADAARLELAHDALDFDDRDRVDAG